MEAWQSIHLLMFKRTSQIFTRENTEIRHRYSGASVQPVKMLKSTWQIFWWMFDQNILEPWHNLFRCFDDLLVFLYPSAWLIRLKLHLQVGWWSKDVFKMNCELLATCSALGYLEGEIYHKEVDCLGEWFFFGNETDCFFFSVLIHGWISCCDGRRRNI